MKTNLNLVLSHVGVNSRKLPKLNVLFLFFSAFVITAMRLQLFGLPHGGVLVLFSFLTDVSVGFYRDDTVGANKMIR